MNIIDKLKEKILKGTILEKEEILSLLNEPLLMKYVNIFVETSLICVQL